ncbi:MAG: ABC transporter permease [Gemmatimonadetes bacterium]|nr:ABC transporter permease [Gemmatimonadota bacterium]MCC6773610.1 ABC transporter permease [Gemmatimonadaceae bacterium]
MPFELSVALRYIRSGRLQTVLIFSGVAVGIVVFTFMAALINGLAISLTDNVIGNIAHVRLEPRTRPPQLLGSRDSVTPLVAVQRGDEPRANINGWRAVVQMVEAVPGVTRVAASVTGSGFIQRGERIVPVSVTGYEEGKLSAMVDLAAGIVRGTATIGPGDVLIGVGIAEELGLTTGQRLRLRSDRGRERTLVIRGIFDVQSANLNDRLAFTDLGTAQGLFEVVGAVTRIELKVADIFGAPALAERLAGMTGLEAIDWIAENARLQDALTAQGNTGDLVKFFSVLLIIIAVASQLLLSVMRRKPEIGIMRSMGITRSSVTWIFLLQGLFIGLLGSLLGALLGYGFSSVLAQVTLRPDGSQGLPIDPALGEYGLAVAIATVASTLAALLPARIAARTDPMEVITQ